MERLAHVGPENLAECGIGCLVNRSNPGYRMKEEWLHSRFDEGLRILLFRDERGKPLAFLEYVPGEAAWRPVEAPGWLFVHCLWVYAAGEKVGGLGSRLIRACVDEARLSGNVGVAAMASDGPWMVGSRIFLKNGFERIDEAGRFQLVAHRLRVGPQPRFADITGQAARYQGLHLVTSGQCPMLLKSVHDLTASAAKMGLDLQVTVLRSAQEAQHAPSHYGVFSLLWNGRLLADHYVSGRRFETIVRREVLADGADSGSPNH